MAKYGSRSSEQTSRANGERIVRVLQICWLLQREEVSVERLAERFAVSRRTIFRDLRLISSARLPLAMQRNENGLRLTRTMDRGFMEEAERPRPDLS